MTRNDFFKCCTSGMCSCAAFALLPQEPVQAQSGNPELDALKWKLDFVNRRFATLIGILNEKLDPATRKQILENLGRECAKNYRGLFDKHKNDIQGFLDAIQKQWVEKAEYDREADTIRIVDKSKTCTCALVNQGMTPPEFCDCTLGWQQAAYSAVLGRSVEVTLEESILRGASRCVFRIRIV